MESADLLLEIGVEEMPARYCAPALAQLRSKAEAGLSAARLGYGDVATLGTPRRLTLLVRNLALRQPDRDIVNKGPAAGVAFDAAGAPTKAAQGFARGQGVAVEALTVESDEKGAAYVYARKHEAGRDAAEILPALLSELILGLDFPRSMRWGEARVRFARPIRWLLCLLGDQPIPVEVDEIVAGATTRGHRTLASAPELPVPTSGAYARVCATGGVMVDPIERRETIWRQVQAVAAELGGYVPPNEDLLDEVTWLVEQPHAFAGSFDPAFLALPSAVLVTSMRAHQRYFPVYAADRATLLPHFIAVRNGRDAYLQNVRHGNEKVLNARLNDARFFWDEDRRRPLAARLDALEAVVFQQELGSQFARTERIARLAARVAEALVYDDETRTHVARAALLCKCDLITDMVGEFPELQGVMGRAYALADGEVSAVADGIAEHYLPRGAGDSLPTAATGIAVGLSDRLDTLAGFFRLGLSPTGSADPFALRRAALGLARIIVEGGYALSLSALLGAALAGYDAADDAATLAALLDFMRARLEGIMGERGLRYDVIDAALVAGFEDMSDAVARAEALAAQLATARFTAVLEAFKRAANISAKAAEEGESPSGDGLPSLIPDPSVPAETALWDAFSRLRGEAEARLAAREYGRFYELTIALKEPIDAFFDGVMVMDPDPAIRQRRLAMLREITALLTRPADLKRLAVG